MITDPHSTAARAFRNERFRRILGSMPNRFKVGKTSILSNEMLSYAISLSREYSRLDADSLRPLLREHLEQKIKGQDAYQGWWMSILVWWLLPKFIEWFLSEWFDDLKTHGPAI